MLKTKNKIAFILLTFSIFLLFSLIINNNAFAVSSTSMTIIDDNIGTETKFNPSNTNKSGNGWSWNKDTSTLTLNGFDGQRIEANGDFTLKLVGTNYIRLTGQSAKGLYADYSDGRITIEKNTSDDNDKLIVDCNNVSGESIIGASAINHNGGTVILNVTQTKDGLGRAYGPYCNSGYYLYNNANLKITMSSNKDSRLQGLGILYCRGNGTVNININGLSNSIGLSTLKIDDGSSSKVYIDVQDSDPNGYITYAIESLDEISEKGYLNVAHGRIQCGYSYNSYPIISSKTKITTKNSSLEYVVFPLINNGYRCPTFIDATTFEPIVDGIVFEPQSTEVPFVAASSNILKIKSSTIEEDPVTEFQNFSFIYLPSILHGLNYDTNSSFATYEVVSGTLPEGLNLSYNYGSIGGTFTEPCDAGSFTVKVTRKSDGSTVNVKINYGKIIDTEKFLTIDVGTANETKVNLTQFAEGAGWNYSGNTNTLELHDYTGGPIYTDKGLNIVLFGNNTINVKNGDEGAILGEYFKSVGEIGISAIGSGKLNINVDSSCTTIGDAIINTNKLNIFSGTLNIVAHNIETRLYGIYCNNGTYIVNDDAGLNIDLSTKDNFVEAVNSLYVNDFEGNINISIQSGDYDGAIEAIPYLRVYNGSPNITISAKASNIDCKNYAVEDIEFNTDSGKITINEGIVATSYNYSGLLKCTNKTKITTKNSSKDWILIPLKNYLNNATILVDSNTFEPIKDGIIIETQDSLVSLKFKSSEAFNVPKSLVGSQLKSFNGISGIFLRGGLEGINIFDESMNFKVIEGTLPKGITLGNASGSLYGTFEEITQPSRVKIRATRLEDNKFVDFYINVGLIYSDDPSLAFPDVPNDKWYSDNIKYVKDHGIMSGYADGTFGVNDSIARGQIVLMFYRLAGTPSVSSLPNPFSDVPEGKYFTDAVKWAVAKNITTGKTATTFDPYGNVTRQELAVFFARYAKNILNKDITSTYNISNIADYNDLSTWARPQMQYIMEKGIITGDMALGYARILPRNNATRAMAATMFTRFCQNIAGME